MPSFIYQDIISLIMCLPIRGPSVFVNALMRNIVLLTDVLMWQSLLVWPHYHY